MIILLEALKYKAYEVTRSILFVSKIAIFVFGFSVLAVSMEESFIDPNDPSLVQKPPLRLSSTAFMEEAEDFMKIFSPHLSDNTITPVTYVGDGNSPVNDDGEWRGVTTGLVTTPKDEEPKEEPKPESKKRKGRNQSGKPKKRITEIVEEDPTLLDGGVMAQSDSQSSSSSLVISFSKLKKSPEKGEDKPKTTVMVHFPTEQDLAGLSEELLEIYDEITQEVRSNQQLSGALSYYQWTVLGYFKKIDDGNLSESLGVTQKDLKRYRTDLKEFNLLTFHRTREAETVPAPTMEDLAGLNDEQLLIYNQVATKMETGDLALGTLARNQWIVLTHLKGMSVEGLNKNFLHLAKKTFGDYKSRLTKVGLLNKVSIK